MDSVGLGTAAIIATMLIPVVSFVKKEHWPTQIKYLAAMVAAMVAAIVGAVVDGHVSSWATFVAYFGTALATSQTIYTTVFANTQVEQNLAAK